MTMTSHTAESSATGGWRRDVSPRQAGRGIALIVAVMAVLGLLSVGLGSSSDSSAPVPLYVVAR